MANNCCSSYKETSMLATFSVVRFNEHAAINIFDMLLTYCFVF